MVPPLLKLEFIAGPRAGDSLDFKPGSNVRVGRIVRGNEIAIKDGGISSKHLKIVSDSENWIIHDLGSSNGTTLNSESIDPEEPVNLSHGDVIKLGEYTSIVVNLVNDVPAPQKLPPRTRRNNKSVAVSDPIETEQEKPKRRGRSSKQEEKEVPVRTRASRKRALDEIADKEEELEAKVAKKVNSRVGRSRKNAKEEVPEEKKSNFKVPKGKNNENVQESSPKIKVEVVLLEDSPKEVKIPEVKSRKRATRSKQIEDTVLEEIVEKRTSRATRSKKTDIGGDSFMELEMVLKKSRAKRKKPEQSVVKMMDRNDDAGEEALKNCHVGEDKENDVQGGCSERIEDICDKEDKRVEQVEIELRTKSSIGEDDMNCTVREDGETENLQDIEKENENEVQGDCSERIEDRCDKEDEREGNRSKSVEQAEIELRKKITIGEDDLNCTIRVDGETENLQDVEEEKENEVQEGCSKRSDEEDEREGDGSKSVEQAEIELRQKRTIGEDDLNCPVTEDVDTEQQTEEESGYKVEEAGIATLDDQGKVEQGSSSKNVEVDLEKMTLDDWFDYMEVQLPKQIIEETGKMIEGMRSKALRVHKYITEQKAKGL